MNYPDFLAALNKLGHKSYDSYLRSPQWQQRRISFAKKFREKCSVCEDDTDCRLHHISYDRVGKERNSDLIWLCRFHHDTIHGIVNGKATVPVPDVEAHLRLRDQWLDDGKSKSRKSPPLTDYHQGKDWREGRLELQAKKMKRKFRK